LRYFHPVLPARDLESRPRRVEVAGQPYVLFRVRMVPQPLWMITARTAGLLFRKARFVRMAGSLAATMAGISMEKAMVEVQRARNLSIATPFRTTLSSGSAFY